MEAQYLFQRISIAVQRGDVVSFLNTFSEDYWNHFNHTIFPNEINFHARAFGLIGLKNIIIIIIRIIIVIIIIILLLLLLLSNLIHTNSFFRSPTVG